MAGLLRGLFISFLFFSTINAIQDFSDRRLIEFNETYRQWMTTAEVEKLISDLGSSHTGFMDITDHPDLGSGPKIPVGPLPSTPTHQAVVNAIVDLIDGGQIKTFNDGLSKFFTRFYTTQTGLSAAQHIHKTFSKIGKNNSEIEVEYFEHSFLQPSVIARIPGTGEHANEVVIISAHEDSVAGGSAGRSPGADDDGSGVSCVLEAFRVLTKAGFIPDRTLEFHTYAAEEAGLLGSQDVASTYYDFGKVVYAQLQLDMTMYGSTAPIGIITDYTDKELTTFVTKLVDSYTELSRVDSICGYACSDHASWTKAGYRASFPFETAFGDHNPYIHTSEDTWDKLSLQKGVQFVQLAVGFAVELAA